MTALTDPVDRILNGYSETVQPPPFTAHWDITWRCDHSCIHCYLVDRKQDELTFEEGSRLLHELAELGVFSLLVSGGDPFLRPDALALLTLAKELNFDVSVNTHGNFIDDELADKLAEIGISSVGISLYSGNAEDHEAVTRIKGSFEKTVAAARRLTERGISVTLKSPVTRHNADTIETAKAIADDIGTRHARDPHLLPDEDGDFEMMSIRPDRDTRIWHAMKAMERGREGIAQRDYRPASSDLKPCKAGNSAMHIGPDGKVYSCVQLRLEAGDWRKQSLSEIWYESPVFAQLRGITRASYLVDCEGCTFHEFCGYCPALSYDSTGDPGRRSPHACDRTHVKMSAREYMERLVDDGRDIPELGSPELAALFSKSTFADRQWAARQAKYSTQKDRLAPDLVQIGEPRATVS